MPYLSQPGQSLLRWYADDVAATLIQPRANVVPIPDGPGLGVILDAAALERCKQRFVKEGVISQLGEPDLAHYRRFQAQ